MHVVIPPWYHSRGVDGLLRALREERGAIKHDLDTRMDWENFSQSVGWEKIFVSSVVSEANQPCVGKSISQIAAERGHADPADAAFDLLVEEQLAVGMISFGLDEADITAIMRHPAVSFITDRAHERKAPTRAPTPPTPRILGRYVREQGVLSLEEAVRKMTRSPPARSGCGTRASSPRATTRIWWSLTRIRSSTKTAMTIPACIPPGSRTYSSTACSWWRTPRSRAHGPGGSSGTSRPARETAPCRGRPA